MKLDDKIIKGKQYIDRLRNEYIEKHTRFQERDELIAENNIEKREIKGYHGREILELLQNADDAYQKSIDRGESPQCKLKVTICYKNNVLTVTNTGTCFDEAGIKAIVQGNNSPKSGKYIGNKGTGFRSVLNWAEKVRIFSGNFSVEFSKEIADKILEELKDKVQIQKQIKRNSHLYIPMLAVPYNIENRGYSDITTIEVVTDPTKLNDDFSVSKQLENIDLRILLLLPNISQIDIITDDNHIIYRRNINTDALESISLEKTIDGNVEVEEGTEGVELTYNASVVGQIITVNNLSYFFNQDMNVVERLAVNNGDIINIDPTETNSYNVDGVVNRGLWKLIENQYDR